MAAGEVMLRDPLWDTIRLDATAMRIVDSPAFQRLRYIKQLGLAHLVYPGATHTRFDHALGVYHLARRALSVMQERGALATINEAERILVPFAALLHDIGHYPFSHAVEELEESTIPGHHEAVVGRFLADTEVAGALRDLSLDAAGRIEQLIRGASPSALQGLVSGSLDLDKIEYLQRDAHFCGVPYGDVDVDRLLYSLIVAEDPATGKHEIGVHEKGVAALESLLFAKYQMFRNVYWHHAVRAATVMYKRIVADALTANVIEPDELVGQTDEGLLYLLETRAETRMPELAANITALRTRRLPKRVCEIVAGELGENAEWLAGDTDLKRQLEDRIALELSLQPGTVFIDYPEKTAMFALDLLVQRRSGEVIRVGARGRAGLIGLPRVSDELYRTARVLRIFSAGARRSIEPGVLEHVAAQGAEALTVRLASSQPLL
jgi:HD superfamily phosphohydrolase